MEKIILFSVAVIGLAVFAGKVQAQNIIEGEWSMTMTTRMEGMEDQAREAMAAMENMSPEEKAMMQQMMGGMNINMGAGGMTTTTSTCISSQDPVPPMEAEEGCQQSHSVDGNTVTFETICDESSSTGQVTYNGEAMEGTIISHQNSGGEETVTTIEISGQYVGPCTQ